MESYPQPMPDVVSVRQTRDLPPASFRFHLTVDTLALSYTLPTTRACSGLSPVGLRPCWAHIIHEASLTQLASCITTIAHKIKLLVFKDGFPFFKKCSHPLFLIMTGKTYAKRFCFIGHSRFQVHIHACIYSRFT